MRKRERGLRAGDQRCGQAGHTQHKKHACAVVALQHVQYLAAPVELLAPRGKNAALVEVVDGGTGAVRGFARLGLTAETRSRGTALCRPRRHR